MSNLNTVADVILRQNNGQPIVFAVTTDVHASFSISGATAVLSLPNPLAAADAPLGLTSRAATGIPFLIRVAGELQLGRGVGYQIDLNQGTGLTPAIASTGLQTAPLGAGLYLDNFFLEVEALWDPNPLNLRGIQYGWVGATAIAQSAIVGSSPAALANLQFNIGVTIINPNPGNQVTITAFDAEWL
jgi:hypothetical protein